MSMRAASFEIEPDIARANTLDPVFYTDPEAYAATRERIFARTWQWLGDLADVALPSSLSPRDLLPGLLDEPLLLARDAEGTLRCLSNVCTHRANVLVRAPCRAEQIRCGYHSRRFDLAGRMTFMPEFADARDFPSPADDLPQVPFAQWSGHGFASLDPAAPLAAFLGDLRVPWLPVERLAHDPARDRDYSIAAHWALYVENYLEGFHIPFVHASLNEAVDYASYSTELFRYASLPAGADPQRRGGRALLVDLSQPHAQLLSVGPVRESGRAARSAHTRVRFRSYVGDAGLLDAGAGRGLDRVEAEDEAIVEAVQRGVRSRYYRGGRYSPTRERGVHHFHRLLAEFLQGAP